jgi:hypothetical protein
MRPYSSWNQGLMIGLAGVLSVIVVADVHGGIFRRRRGNRYYNTGGYISANAGVYNAGGGASVGVAPNVNVATPDVEVNAGLLGASVTAPGVNVNAGVNGQMRTGANLNVPAADVRAGANANLPNGNTDIRVRGQTPDTDIRPGIDAASRPIAPPVVP